MLSYTLWHDQDKEDLISSIDQCKRPDSVNRCIESFNENYKHQHRQAYIGLPVNLHILFIKDQ